MPRRTSSPRTKSRIKPVLLCAIAGILAGVGNPAFAQTAATSPGWEEDYAWALTRRNGSPEAYQWFLERYPDSRYSDFAFREVIETIVGKAVEGQPEAPARARGTEVAGTAVTGGHELPF